VNRLFGTLLLGMALYFVSPLLSDAVTTAAVPPHFFAVLSGKSNSFEAD